MGGNCAQHLEIELILKFKLSKLKLTSLLCGCDSLRLLRVALGLWCRSE